MQRCSPGGRLCSVLFASLSFLLSLVSPSLILVLFKLCLAFIRRQNELNCGTINFSLLLPHVRAHKLAAQRGSENNLGYFQRFGEDFRSSCLKHWDPTNENWVPFLFRLSSFCTTFVFYFLSCHLTASSIFLRVDEDFRSSSLTLRSRFEKDCRSSSLTLWSRFEKDCRSSSLTLWSRFEKDCRSSSLTLWSRIDEDFRSSIHHNETEFLCLNRTDSDLRCPLTVHQSSYTSSSIIRLSSLDLNLNFKFMSYRENNILWDIFLEHLIVLLVTSFIVELLSFLFKTF